MVYVLLSGGKLVRSAIPGKYAGHKGYKIFGTLNCKSGMRIKKENRVFFLDLESAVKEGYRPCKLCKPLGEQDFLRIKHLIPYPNLETFYDSGRQFR